METERPVVRLRPTVPPHPFRGGGLTGAPWAYQDQIVLDRRTRALPAGSIASNGASAVTFSVPVADWPVLITDASVVSAAVLR